MSGAIKQYLDRSMNVLKRNTAKVIHMDGTTTRPAPLPLLNFASSSAHPVTPLTDIAIGSDADIGGTSSCSINPVSSSSADDATQSHVVLHGNLSLAVPAQYAGRIRTGYAAFRTKTRPSLFGEDMWDLSLYSHLKVIVAYRGLEAWRDRWYVNIQTDGPVQSDLFQHRLPLPPSPSTITPSSPSDPPTPTFHTLHVPLSSFILTNSGKTSSSQLPMMREKIRTIGISLLGGGRNTEESHARASDAAIGAGASDGALAEAQRLAAGGWKGGKGESGGEVYVDKEMEDLLRSDLPAGAQLPGNVGPSQPSTSRSAGSYHRVGSSSVPEMDTQQETDTDLQQEAQEGYYELSIKSVEAVKWDPEADDEV